MEENKKNPGDFLTLQDSLVFVYNWQFCFSHLYLFWNTWLFWCLMVSLTCSEALGGCSFLYILPWDPNPGPWLLFQPRSLTPRPSSTYSFLYESQVLGPSAWNVLSSQRCLLKPWSSGLLMKPLMVFPPSQTGMFFFFLGLFFGKNLVAWPGFKFPSMCLPEEWSQVGHLMSLGP